MGRHALKCNSLKRYKSRSAMRHMKFVDRDDTIIVCKDIVAQHVCETIIEICESFVAVSGGDIWKSDDCEKYPQATNDLEVDKIPELMQYLKHIKLVNTINNHFNNQYNQSIVSFDDIFVVKYDASAGGQKELIEHTDAGLCNKLLYFTDDEYSLTQCCILIWQS